MIIQAYAQRLPLADQSIDCIVTDPPYGISYKSNRQSVDRSKSIATGKDVSNKAAYFNAIAHDNDVPVGWFSEAYRVLRMNTACYVFTRWDKQHIVIAAGESCGFRIKNAIILMKSNHGMGDLKGAYAPSYETLLFFTKGRHLLHKRLKDVWAVPVKFSGARRAHPCEKPSVWMEPAINNSTLPGDWVLDPFCGSGSTGVAAAKSGCRFVGCDIDAQWLLSAKQRTA